MKIRLSKSANEDLKKIGRYIKENAGREQANEILNRLENTISSLTKLPNRGVRVRELVNLGLHSYREIFSDCYRIIYEVEEQTVYIHFIIDKRRDLVPLLSQKLLD